MATDVAILDILKSGRCVNKQATDKYKNQAKNIFYAISKGDMPMLRKLVQNGADVNAVSTRGQSPIYLGKPILILTNYLAAKYGYKDMLQFLVDNGANLKAQNTYNTTPLHIAVDHNHEHVVEYMLQSGVNIHAKDANSKQGKLLALSCNVT
jgi:ankyrin repeat protein